MPLTCWNVVMSTVRACGLPSSIMAHLHARSRRLPVSGVAAAVATMAVGGACGSADDATSATTSAAVAEALAPSQVSASTVPEPTIPGACDPDDVVVTVVRPSDGVAEPDQIIELTNAGDRECDVDISRSSNAGPEMEPSVRLVPGGVGLVWVDGETDCNAEARDPSMSTTMWVNGEERSIELVFGAPCGVEFVAFFAD